MRGALYQVLFGGGLVALTQNVQAPTGANGLASLLVPLPAPPAPSSLLVFVVRDVVAPAGSPPYVLALDTQLSAGIGY